MKNLNKRNNKKSNGITLIALVITIIVLLILAGISISMLTGENGLLTKTDDARTKTAIANEEEQIKVQVMASYNNEGKLDLEITRDSIESYSCYYKIKEVSGSYSSKTNK